MEAVSIKQIREPSKEIKMFYPLEVRPVFQLCSGEKGVLGQIIVTVFRKKEGAEDFDFQTSFERVTSDEGLFDPLDGFSFRKDGDYKIELWQKERNIRFSFEIKAKPIRLEIKTIPKEPVKAFLDGVSEELYLQFLDEDTGMPLPQGASIPVVFFRRRDKEEAVFRIENEQGVIALHKELLFIGTGKHKLVFEAGKKENPIIEFDVQKTPEGSDEKLRKTLVTRKALPAASFSNSLFRFTSLLVLAFLVFVYFNNQERKDSFYRGFSFLTLELESFAFRAQAENNLPLRPIDAAGAPTEKEQETGMAYSNFPDLEISSLVEMPQELAFSWQKMKEFLDISDEEEKNKNNEAADEEARVSQESLPKLVPIRARLKIAKTKPSVSIVKEEPPTEETKKAQAVDLDKYKKCSLKYEEETGYILIISCSD